MAGENKREFELDIRWDDNGTRATVIAMDRRGLEPIPVEGLPPILFSMDSLSVARKHAAAVSGISKRIQDDTAVERKGRTGLEVIKMRHALAVKMVEFLSNGGDEWKVTREPRVDEVLEDLVKALGVMRPEKTEAECRSYLIGLGKDGRYQLYTDRTADNALWPFLQVVLEEKVKGARPTKSLLAGF